MYAFFVVKKYNEHDVVVDFFGEGSGRGALWSEPVSAELLDAADAGWDGRSGRRDREKSMVALAVTRAAADPRVRYHEVRRESTPAAKIIFFGAHGSRCVRDTRSGTQRVTHNSASSNKYLFFNQARRNSVPPSPQRRRP